jgi:hypothetical protein
MRESERHRRSHGEIPRVQCHLSPAKFVAFAGETRRLYLAVFVALTVPRPEDVSTPTRAPTGKRPARAAELRTYA